MDLRSLAALIGSHRIRFGTELQMQDDIELLLQQSGIAADRERRLAPGPIDFLVSGGIGIECKIGGSLSEVLRQCRGYAACEEVTAILIVSSRASHLAVPSELGEKPLKSVWVARAAL